MENENRTFKIINIDDMIEREKNIDYTKLMDIDSLKNLSRKKLLERLNEIVIETDYKKQKELIINLYAYDYIFKEDIEGNEDTPLYRFKCYCICQYMRDPTTEEYEEFFNNNVEKCRFWFENKRLIPNTKLRKLLISLYDENDMIEKINLFTKYISPIKEKREKYVKPITKKEVIQILRQNGIYKVGNLQKMSKTKMLKLYPEVLAKH